MKNGLIMALWLGAFGLITTAAERGNNNRVPPPGLAIAETNRAELRAGADQLAKEIAVLREELKHRPWLLEREVLSSRRQNVSSDNPMR